VCGASAASFFDVTVLPMALAGRGNCAHMESWVMFEKHLRVVVPLVLLFLVQLVTISMSLTDHIFDGNIVVTSVWLAAHDSTYEGLNFL